MGQFSEDTLQLSCIRSISEVAQMQQAETQGSKKPRNINKTKISHKQSAGVTAGCEQVTSVQHTHPIICKIETNFAIGDK